MVGVQTWWGTDWITGHIVLTFPVGLGVAGHAVLTLHGTGCGWAHGTDSLWTGCGWAHGPDSLWTGYGWAHGPDSPWDWVWLDTQS